MAPPTLVFFDTTAFSQDSSLTSAAWDSLASAARSGLIRLAISEVTVAELTRQVREKIEKVRETISSDAKALQAHGVVYDLPDVPPAAEFEPALRARLAVRGVSVLPLPAVDHVELLARDVEVRLPFNRSGKGYRDALIWHSFLEWLTSETLTADTYFVTANTTDFADKDKESLSPDLAAELPKHAKVQLLKNVSDAATKARELKKLPAIDANEPPEEPPAEISAAVLRSAEQAAVKAFHALTGQEWEQIEALPFTLQPVESVSVVWVEVDEDSLQAELVDTVSETMIWDVRASAVLSVEGLAYRGEAFVLSHEWDVSAGSFEEHYVDASRSIRCTLVADVRVEADGETSEAAITEIIIDEDDR